MTPHGGEMGSGDKEIRQKGASRGHSGFRQTVSRGAAVSESSESPHHVVLEMDLPP